MPGKELKAAKRYAKALFQATAEVELDKRQKALEMFTETWQECSELRDSLLNPVVVTGDRIAAVEALSDRIEGSDKHFRNFLCLLMLNNRLTLLPEVTEWFADLVREAQKVRKVEITSAFELPEEERSSIHNQVESQFESTVSIEWKVDAEILGGLVIRHKDLVLDSSLAGSLARIRNELRG